MGEVKFMPSGDRAMVVEFGNAIDTRINDQVHTLARRIEEEQIPGIVELVPTFRSLMVYYDPFLTSYAKLKAVLENSGEIGAGSGEKKKRILKIPCCYGARFGQDPRVKIQPGAVGIGGNQTGVYPLASPGGWRLMGGTPVDFYDPDREEPILCKAGEFIRFIPITIDDYYDIRRMIVNGTYQVEVLEEDA